VAFSRVLLALPKTGSTVVAIAVAASILLVAALVATRPRVSSAVLTGVLVLAAVALLAGGIVGAVAGERDIEEHKAEETPRPEERPNTQDPNPNAPPETTGSSTEVPGP
jgi:flagellar basal body-associated protein FliL